MPDCTAKTLASNARIPSSTYRLQMHENFTFADAEAVLPYLKRLGIGDVYLSPIFEARPHSMHGYDVARHDCLNPELGGQKLFAGLTAALRKNGMGLLLDTVPNHMGVGNESLWWQDVLENGRASEFSSYFDIDWAPLKQDMQNRLLLPILGCQYGEALEAKQIQVKVQDGRARVTYFDHELPLAPRTYALLFPKTMDAEFGVTKQVRTLLDKLEELPLHETADKAKAEQRRARLRELKPQLQAQLQDSSIQSAISKALIAVNGVDGQPRSFDSLHMLLDAQPYRLAYWRTSSEQINYRRFFDVNDLVGLRMEEPEVFAKTHSLIRSMLAKGEVTGLRIDHCDGMFNPHVYLERLQQLFVAAKCCGPVMNESEATASGIEQSVLDATRGHDWTREPLPLYCVVEKILEPGETLPRTWAVQGTSGYDFVHFANQFFIQSKNRRAFDALYAAFIGEKTRPSQVIYESKRSVLQTSLASEAHVLGNLLSQLAAADRRVRDFTDVLLETTIRETIACFPIYRTYIDERGQYSGADTKTIQTAIRLAKRRNPGVDASAFDYLQRVLLLDGRGKGESERDEAQLYFALKFQQLTGPVMAKGVEDTSFYVYCRFLSSNEVGSAMDAFGLDADTLHRANQERLQHTPHAMLTTSTHDTKRSEDVRNRLNVLSEMPETWAAQVNKWAEENAALKTTLDDGTTAPDANEEYLIYQTIAGAWPWATADQPGFTERVQQYMAKALSEGKVNVSWINPRPDYVEAVQQFVGRLLQQGTGERPTPFVTALEQFLEPVRLHGAINSLAQMVLKATSPGVPDFYQGSELWDLSLVDPDNRRPVDYKLRAGMLDSLLTKPALEAAQEVLTSVADGRIKLWTMQKTLAVRSEYQRAFVEGSYLPLQVSNEYHSFAYKRGDDVIVVLPRFSYSLMQGAGDVPLGNCWADQTVSLPAASSSEPETSNWLNAFTGKSIASRNNSLSLQDVFADFPVAILLQQH